MPDTRSKPDFGFWLRMLEKFLRTTLKGACEIIAVTNYAVMFNYTGKTNTPATGAIKVDLLISPYVTSLMELYRFLEPLEEKHQSRYSVGIMITYHQDNP